MIENDISTVLHRHLDNVHLKAQTRAAVLSAARGEKRMKKKLSLGLVMTIVLVLLAVGAVAAAINWNVMDFLFGENQPQVGFLVKDLEAQTSDGQVTLNVNSALCDGEMLAMDWTVSNTKPDKPVYLQIDRFYANDVRLWSDGTDSFDCQWLPGWSSDGTMQDGESIMLPDEITGDRLSVELLVGVYRPIKPVYLMETYNEQEAKEKLNEGYHIIAQGDGFVLPDPDTGGLMHCFGLITGDALADYERTELTITFELDMKAAREACVALDTQPSYEFDGLTARYTKASLTPVGLYLTLELTGGEQEPYNALLDNASFELTDGEGKPFEHPWDEYETGGYETPDGELKWESSHKILGVTAQTLPKTLSLSLVNKDGKALQVFPLTVPAQ